MSTVDLGKVRGTQIYTGSAMTGTSSVGKVFATGIAKAYVGDVYINTDASSNERGNVYECVLSGNASTAKWSYTGNVKGPAVEVVNNLESTSTTEALCAYQGTRLYQLLVDSGILCKSYVFENTEKVYGIRLTIANVKTTISMTIDGGTYKYTSSASGSSEKRTVTITVGTNLGLSQSGGVVTKIVSSDAYMYSVELLDSSSATIYKSEEIWDCINAIKERCEIAGTVTDGTENVMTGNLYKFLNGVKNFFYPITHAKAVWYSKSNSQTVYDKIAELVTSISAKAPTSHRSTATTYGSGTTTYYGHVKLSSSVSSTTTSGVAANPYAVKQAYDLANTANTRAEKSLEKTGGEMTGPMVFVAEDEDTYILKFKVDGVEYEVLRVYCADGEMRLLINDGMYSKSVGETNVSAGDTVRLITQAERLVLEASGDSTYSAYLRPYNDNKCTLGNASKRFAGLWAGKSTIQTSDEREKENIVPLGISQVMMIQTEDEQMDIHSELFDRLRAVQYNFIEGDGRVCYGLIAQEVLESMKELGIDENDLDLVHHEYWVDKDTNEEKETYGIAYANLIAMLIYEVQKLKSKVETLEAEVHEA